MLSLLVLWTILGITFTFIGIPILYTCNLQTCLHKPEDRIFIAIWLGIIVLANLLLFASLFTALTLYVAAFLVALMLMPYFFRRYKFWTKRPSVDFVAGGALIVGTLLVAALAAIMSGVNPYDSGLYHIQTIAWLAEYGSVPGLALIHHPFGYTNAWFALIAPLKIEWLQDHFLMGMNGFIFYIMMAQTIAKLHRVWNRYADVGDWFFIISCALFCRLFFPGLIFSMSSDLSATLLIVVVAWLITALSINSEATTGGTRQPGLAILILASGAVSIKFGSMPLLGIAAIYYVLTKGLNFRKIWIALAIIAPFAAIHMLVSTITSGCPLYPTPYFCTSLPWSLGSENAREVSSTIYEFTKWVGPTPPDATRFNWLWHKPPNDNNLYNDKPLMLGLLIANILCGAWLYLKRKKINHDALCYTALISLSGIAFTIFIVPHLRFGLGFFWWRQH